MQSLQEVYRRSQPLLEQLKMSAVPHQHFLVDIIGARVINIMYSTRCSAAIPDKTSLKIFDRPRWRARRFSSRAAWTPYDLTSQWYQFSVVHALLIGHRASVMHF